MKDTPAQFGKKTKKVDLISLKEGIPIPECLQERKDITFPASKAAGAGISIAKSGLSTR